MNDKINNLQNSLANKDWRIPSKSHKYFENNYYALAAMIVFIAFLYFAVKASETWALYGAIASFLLALFSLFIKAKSKRKKWQVIEAECIDREIKKVLSENGSSWAFRIMCQYEFKGKSYTEPPFFWRSFGSEKSVDDFLKAIIKNNRCELRINPKIPEQVELKADDLKDFLFH